MTKTFDEYIGGAQAGGGTSSVIIRGILNHITFHNPSTGFAVVKVECAPDVEQTFSDSSTITLIGDLPPDVAEGVTIIARGEWQVHPKFGKQFRAFSITATLPTEKDSIISYLSSGLIKGFGPKMAERIVNHFGEKTLNILDSEPSRLLEVSGIGAKKLHEISSNWSQKKNFREVMLYLQGHGISTGLAQRIYRSYGDRTIEKVKSNPYILAKDITGIGFITADKIAASVGIEPSSPFRIRAGLNYALQRSQDDGNVYLTRSVLISKTSSLLKLSDEEVINQVLKDALKEYEFVERGEAIYHPILNQAEDQLAHAIASRISADYRFSSDIPLDYIDRICLSPALIGSSQEQKLIHLSEEQQKAVRLAATSPIVVITGGPGCGKTTVIRAISQLFRRAGLEIKLAAPTGRASQRMSEVCDMEASTIHRLLKYDPISRTFLHNKNYPLPLDALIVDESSMIDLPLAAHLLQALPKGSRIIIVGDADQLPSVGPGLFLADLLGISQIPRVRLTQLFRRAEESSITSLAHLINNSQIPNIPQPDGIIKSDSYFLPAEDPTEAAQLVERLVVDQIPKKFGFKGAEIMVLSPMNQGELGIISLNHRLQDKIVPVTPKLPRVTVGNIEFRLGDRVVQRVNNYQITEGGVFNGDQGEITGIDPVRGTVHVCLWDGRTIEYTTEDLYQLDLAYAITIHRSQGSEVSVVVLALHDTHSILLERQLIYTAVTRAKKLLIIVGTKRALVLAVKKTRSKRRYTGLIERTLQLLKES